jgi:hypothetical protein
MVELVSIRSVSNHKAETAHIQTRCHLGRGDLVLSMRPNGATVNPPRWGCLHYQVKRRAICGRIILSASAPLREKEFGRQLNDDSRRGAEAQGKNWKDN